MNRTEIINQLIKIYGYKSFLEIGVDSPELNFNKIKCNNKVGVDPNPKARATHCKTSDEFFAENKQRYGLVFIDGLHHADQVEKDIENALECLEENGSIVCHDMNPTTKEMQEVPRIQGTWTGDCWRAWLQFRHKRSDLSMHVLDTDYGVGIIRKGHQEVIDLLWNPTFEEWSELKVKASNIIPLENEPVSICIPAFEQYGAGVKTLTDLLKSIKSLKGKFEVIVSDNSEGDELEKVCNTLGGNLDLTYFKNPIRGVSANTNSAISKAKYNLIKPMYQDDKFLDPDAINQIAFALKFDHWVACSGYAINHRAEPYKARHPKYTPEIIEGKNSIGMPSVVAYRKNGIQFDESLKTLLDCALYHELHAKYGEPGYLKQPLIGSRYWQKSTSSQQGNLTKEEFPYVKEKYNL